MMDGSFAEKPRIPGAIFPVFAIPSSRLSASGLAGFL
jgi:hypothetical protein